MPPHVDTVPLFPALNAALHELLTALEPEDWSRPTVHRDRNVKDLVAHLLDTALRRLSMQRDGYVTPAPEIRSYQDLVDFIQQTNRRWMDAAKPLSPPILIAMVRRADEELLALLESLDPEAPAIFPVAWAGEETSKNEFDVAREYTERWHHQQQIRDAVGRPGMTDRAYLHPVLATLLRGAPHAYRDVAAPEGTTVKIEITGEAGGFWSLSRGQRRWQLRAESLQTQDAGLTLDPDVAWRLWTKGLSADEAKPRVAQRGPTELCRPLLQMVSIMA